MRVLIITKDLEQREVRQNLHLAISGHTETFSPQYSEYSMICVPQLAAHYNWLELSRKVIQVQ